MPLIKCKECNREISDKAPSCPNCGNPMIPSNPLRVELVKRENRKWKRVMLLSVIWIFISPYPAMLISGNSDPMPIIFLFIFFGLAGLVFGNVGAWYNERA